MTAAANRIVVGDWERWARACLQATGMPEPDAADVAGGLAATSLWGIDSHGIARLPHYLERLARGSIRARPDIRIEHTGPVTAQVHGDRGQGIVVAHRANREAMALARACGMAAVGVRDSSHCGAIGLYTREAARAGFIGMAFTHSDKVAAPHGGQRAFLGTNPLSLAFPRAGAEPVCVDMATTAIPWNRVINARREQGVLPEGVALDDAGCGTIDPHAARALQPLGGQAHGHKGYALALAVELLCGPLQGNPYGPHIGPMYEDLDRPRHLGAFFIVIDPLRFAGGPGLAQAIEHMAMELASEPGVVCLPGDPEQATRARRLVEGLPVDAALAGQMQAWSERLRVPPCQPARSAACPPIST